MIILKTKGWEEYALLDSGNGKRLERFGKYIISRPDPQIIWKPKKSKDVWARADAEFIRTSADIGDWKTKGKLPKRWLMSYGKLKFYAELTPFKHTGVFPEQSLQWDFITEQISSHIRSNNISSSDSEKLPNVLNLFGYTGIASLAALEAGAKVTHVDASKSTIGYFKDNLQASGLENKSVRYILDDALKFVGRELKRGVKYDGIIMDPPVFGHGPTGERWEFNESFPELLEGCKQLLSDNPLFIIINAYAISSSALMLENMLLDVKEKLGGNIEVGELAIQEQDTDRLLSTGIFGRWSIK